MSAPRVALAACAELPAYEPDLRPLGDALRRAGARVSVVAWDDPGVDWSALDACVIRATWDYAERREEFLAWADRVDSATRLHNTARIVRWNTHKRYLRELSERDVPVIDTCWLDRGTRVDPGEIVLERGWERCLIKPAVGLSARETLRFSADEAGLARARAHAQRLLPDEDLLLQPYLESVETVGEFSAIFVDGELTHSVRKVPLPGDFRVQDDHGASDVPHDPSGEERALARAALDAVGEELLYARVDWLLDGNGEPRLVELELVEPSLFFRQAPHAAERLARGVLARLV